MDLQKCEAQHAVFVASEHPSNIGVGYALRLNALIQFRKNYYVYELNGREGIRLYKFDKKKRQFDGHPRSSCSWVGYEAMQNLRDNKQFKYWEHK